MWRFLREASAGLIAIPLDAAALAHSRGPSEDFADVRVADAAGRQVPYLLELLQEPLAVDLSLRPFTPKTRDLASVSGDRSVYAVELPYADLPSGTLALETTARVFSRSVRAGLERPADRNRRDPWFETLSAAHWVNADQINVAPALSLPVRSLHEREVVIVVDEGDNSPLPIAKARLLLPSYRLRLFHPGRRLQLLYGRDDLARPRYDLALLAPHVMGADARELQAADEGGAVDQAASALVSPRNFWIGLIVAVVVLAGLIVRLIRTREPSA